MVHPTVQQCLQVVVTPSPSQQFARSTGSPKILGGKDFRDGLAGATVYIEFRGELYSRSEPKICRCQQLSIVQVVAAVHPYISGVFDAGAIPQDRQLRVEVATRTMECRQPIHSQISPQKEFVSCFTYRCWPG